MIVEIFYTVASGVFFSIPLGYVLSKVPQFRRMINKEEKEKFNISSDPEELLKKINENGEIIDNGEIVTINLDYSKVPKEEPEEIKGFKRFFKKKKVKILPEFIITRKLYKSDKPFKTPVLKGKTKSNNGTVSGVKKKKKQPVSKSKKSR